MDIQIFDQQQDLKIAQSQVCAIIEQTLSLEMKSCDEISIHFVDTATIRELHYRFFGDSSVTDCISLPVDSPDEDDYCVLGEVFVCPQTALEYAKEHDKDPYLETTLYLVHAILHLLGYEDHGKAEPEMRAAENRHMRNLKNKKLCLNANT